jgi:serine/threonine protein kinase
MNSLLKKRIRIGSRIGENLTVLARLTLRNADPVFLVWNYSAWCPMACKVYSSPRRARREAEALASLSHPNIVRCFGLFEPTHVLMEFLEGSTLSRLLERQKACRLPVADAIRVAAHIGAALELMHGKGIVHLDVKPANIIVASGRPVLFDFDSMRRLGSERLPHVAGTDCYIAPEEALLGEATPAADVFSLGVTLFEMLTGKLPFPEPTSRNRFPQINTPSTPLARYRRDAPAGLEQLLAGCLAREPKDRPPLREILPALNKMLGQDQPMWPVDFHPERALNRKASQLGRPPRAVTDRQRLSAV